MELLRKETKIQINDDVYISRNDHNQLIILNLNTSMYFGLDSVGAVFWEYIKKHENVNVIIKQLSQHFDVGESIIKKDLENLVTQLKNKELVKIVN